MAAAGAAAAAAVAMAEDGDSEQVFIDSLAYIDLEYDEPATRAAVDKLIEEEMHQFTPPNYLASRPAPASRLQSSLVLQGELERVARGEVMQTMDLTRYRLEPPAGPAETDVQAWREAVDNAHAQLGHQRCRLLNLELLQQYGPSLWRLHNTDLENMLKRVQEEAEALQRDADRVNAKRKREQTAKASELFYLSRSWGEQLAKNQQLENANAALELQVKRLRRDAEERGIPVAAPGGSEMLVDGAEHA